MFQLWNTKHGSVTSIEMQNPYSLKSRCKITLRKIPLPPPSWKPSDFFFPYRSPEGRRWFPGGKPWFQDHGQRHRDTPPTAAPGPTHRLLERPPDTMWSILSVGNSLVMWTVNILHLVSQNPHRNLHMDLKTHPVLWNTPFSLDMLHTVNALFSKYC